MVRTYKITYYNCNLNKWFKHLYYSTDLFQIEYSRLLGNTYIKELNGFVFDRKLKEFRKIC